MLKFVNRSHKFTCLIFYGFDTQLSSAKPKRYIPSKNHINFSTQKEWQKIPEALIDEIEIETKRFPPETQKNTERPDK